MKSRTCAACSTCSSTKTATRTRRPFRSRDPAPGRMGEDRGPARTRHGGSRRRRAPLDEPHGDSLWWLGRAGRRHTVHLHLPADGASDQREVVELRKELEQAQQLGEAFTHVSSRPSSRREIMRSEIPPTAPPESGVDRLELLQNTASALAARTEATGWMACARDTAELVQQLGEQAPLAQSFSRRMAVGAELLGDLGLAHRMRSWPSTVRKRRRERARARAPCTPSNREPRVTASRFRRGFPSAHRSRHAPPSCVSCCARLLHHGIAATRARGRGLTVASFRPKWACSSAWKMAARSYRKRRVRT